MRYPGLFILAILLNSPGLAADHSAPVGFQAGPEKVVVPATVKDRQGRLVENLEPNDFRLFEDRAEQKILEVTSHPAPLSVVMLVDTAVSRPTADRVRATFPTLAESIGEFEEAAVLTFSATVQTVVPFTSIKDELHAGLRRISLGADYSLPGETMASPVPRINGWPVGPAPPGAGRPATAAPTPKRIDEAVLEAARQLEPREPWRRKVILLVSDGYNSPDNQVSTNDVQAALRRSGVQVYSIGLDGAGLSLGSSVLARYGRATGGEMFGAARKTAIEPLYARALDQARYQYLLTYIPRRPLTEGAFRTLDVRVKRPGLNVITRDGYLPESGPSQP